MAHNIPIYQPPNIGLYMSTNDKWLYAENFKVHLDH